MSEVDIVVPHQRVIEHGVGAEEDAPVDVPVASVAVTVEGASVAVALISGSVSSSAKAAFTGKKNIEVVINKVKRKQKALFDMTNSSVNTLFIKL